MGDSFDFDRYGSIRERDVDLIVCVAAASLPGVWGLFASAVEPPRVSHSVSGLDGEIDVLLSWPAEAVHVENKIDASFQPTQPERYQSRALNAEQPTSTVLLAPAAYLEAHSVEAAKFDRRVSYEELADQLEAESSPIGAELALVVRHAIEQHRRGRVSEVSDPRTEFFREFATLSEQRGLPFVVTANRGPRSAFFYAHGWDSVAGRKVELVAKFGTHRTVDVQVADAGHLVETLREALESAGVTVRTTEVGTLILGRAAPSLDPDSPTAAQLDDLRLFMEVAVQHRSWWVESGKPAVAAALSDDDDDAAGSGVAAPWPDSLP